MSFFLKTLPPSIPDRLRASGQRVLLEKNHEVFGPDQPLDHVYFLDRGVAAIFAFAGDGAKPTGCAIIGAEGYLLPAVILGADRVANRCRMIVDGSGWLVPTDALLSLQKQESALQKTLLAFAYVMIAQIIATSLSHSRDAIPRRLARLILMLHDRSSSDDMAISHADCASILGVRRPSVTEAMHRLESERLVTNERGFVTVSRRAALRGFAGGSYGKPEADYNRMLGHYF